jgi:AAA+ superfamily predicted ATPase
MIGRTLAGFRVERLLGRGAFKAVYAAANLDAAGNGWPAEVALCISHVQDGEARELLRNELNVVRMLRHPGIVREFGIVEADGLLIAVMELVKGNTLAEALAARGPFPLDSAIEIIRQVGEALDYAHAGLAIHRDIKPANLMLQPDGAVKILDFGLARLMAHSQYRANTRVGSVAYMAPEQFEGAAGLNADLWGLGVTFYQLVTNTLPFVARDDASLLRQILYEPPDLEPMQSESFDPRLARVVAKVLQKDSEKRYQTAAEFVADLRAVQRHAATVNHLEGRIEIHLRAHFPLICLQTFEEDRALASLLRVREAMSARKEVELFVWSETAGLRARDGRLVAEDTIGDPAIALEHVFQDPREAIYVFLDIHRHFTPVTIRLIRDAIWTVKRSRKSLVFVSPSPVVPEELAADATLLFYPPPDLSELESVVETVARDAGVPPADGETRETLARALLGFTSREAERVLRRGLERHGGFNADCAREALVEKEQAVRKEGLVEFCRTDLGFDAVGGLDRLKDWFARRQQAFDPAGRRFGLRPPRGVVLVGVPGCGKSLSAKALANAWGAPLLRMDLGRLYASRLGESEGRLRRALLLAEAVSPCVLWIDELEKAFSGLGQSLDSGVAKRLFGAFLTWLEDRAAPVFVAATANDIQRLPAEFTRKGRFDEVFFVDLPDEPARANVFRIHLRKRGRDPGKFDVAGLARASADFAGAEVEAAVVDALHHAFAAGRDLLDEDLRRAVGETKPLSRTRPELIVNLRAWAQGNARPAQSAKTLNA